MSYGSYYVRSTQKLATLSGLTLEVDVYEAGDGHSATSQDTSLVSHVDGALRVAAIDGVTPTSRTHSHGGVDGAIWAAGVARTLLSGSVKPLTEVLSDINRMLWDSSITNSRDQQQITLAAAEFTFRDEVPLLKIARAGDCMAWVRSDDGSWRRLFSPIAHAPEAAALFDAWLKAHPIESRDWEEQFEMEERVAGRPDAWVTAALGRFPEPKLETCEIAAWPEVLVASDGLNPWASDPISKMSELEFTATDVTAVHVRSVAKA